MKNKLEKNSNKKNEVGYKKISMKGLIWKEKLYDKKVLDQITEKYEISNFLAKLISGRGINTINFESFFKPKIKDNFPDPSLLKDVDKATDLISKYIIKRKKIGIFGDYDVDGVTSTSLLGQFLEELGCPYEFYIPDRTKEGYGPNIEAFKSLLKKNCDLIITVDCGTTAKSVIDLAVKEQLKIIIVDHHQPGNKLPNAFSIINPNQNDDLPNLKNLAAVGVTFLLVVSINRKLRNLNFYHKKSEPNLINYLDLVALGTVCDVVELKGLNRAIVKQGLKVLNNTRNSGLTSLIESSGILKDIDEYHLGYILGPRINAGGRVGKSDKGVELLLTKNKSQAMILANQLSELNLERQKIERKVEESAISKINLKEKILCVNSYGWHEGVIGIVAGKLVDKFMRPSIVISEGDDICKGSARSFGDFDIGYLISQSVEQGILEGGGGHKMAGGLSIKKEKIPLFKKFLNNYVFNKNYRKIKEFDLKLFLSNINLELLQSIKTLAPFGAGNPRPKFCISNCFVKFAKLVGTNHVSCFLCDIYGHNIKAIAFNAYDNKVGESILNNQGELIKVIGMIGLNEWQGKKDLQIQIEDVLI